MLRGAAGVGKTALVDDAVARTGGLDSDRQVPLAASSSGGADEEVEDARRTPPPRFPTPSAAVDDCVVDSAPPPDTERARRTLLRRARRGRREPRSHRAAQRVGGTCRACRQSRAVRARVADREPRRTAASTASRRAWRSAAVFTLQPAQVGEASSGRRSARPWLSRRQDRLARGARPARAELPRAPVVASDEVVGVDAKQAADAGDRLDLEPRHRRSGMTIPNGSYSTRVAGAEPRISRPPLISSSASATAFATHRRGCGTRYRRRAGPA